MKNTFLAALLLWVGCSSFLLAENKRQTVFINGGFEFSDTLNTIYRLKCVGGTFSFDSTSTYSGRYSGCFKNREGLAQFVMGVPARDILFLSDQELRLDFKLKSNIGQGSTFHYGLVQTNMKDSNFSTDSCIKSSDWEQRSICLKLDKSQVGTSFILSISIVAEGEVCAWIDDMKLYANDELISEELLLDPLSVSEKEWLNRNVYPVKSDNIIDVVNENRIVGIGEETHGSSTIKKGRSDLIKYIAENIDQDIVILSENQFIDSSGLESLLSMNGDSAKKDRYSEWIEKHNEKKNNRVQLIGMDFSPIAFIDFIKKQSDGELVAQVDLLESEFLPVYFDASKKYVGRAFTLDMSDSLRSAFEIALQDCKEWVGLTSKDADTQALYAFAVELLTDCLDISYDKRDAIMAKIVRFVAMHRPDHKLFVLAHNKHVSRDLLDSGAYSVGRWLSEWFTDTYYIVGTTFGSGSYDIRSSHSNGAFERRQAAAAFPGSFEYLLNMADAEEFVLPLRSQKLLKHENEWLFKAMFHRSLGAVDIQEKFIKTSLPDNYDAVYFIKQVE